VPENNSDKAAQVLAQAVKQNWPDEERHGRREYPPRKDRDPMCDMWACEDAGESGCRSWLTTGSHAEDHQHDDFVQRVGVLEEASDDLCALALAAR